MVDRTLRQRQRHGAQQLVAVEGLALAGRLHDGQLAELHPLEGGETRAAVRALTAPADGGVVLRRPRILNLRVLVTAKRTAHEPPSPSGATAAPAAVAAQLPTLSLDRHVRSEARRVGKECVSTCRSRWSRYHQKKQ